MEEQGKAKITFFAAECMEFLDCGEKYEDLSLPEAVEAYQRICKKGSAYGPMDRVSDSILRIRECRSIQILTGHCIRAGRLR